MGIDTLSRAAKAAVASSVSELVWYTVAAASTYLFFSVLFRSRLAHRRASPRDPAKGQIRREVAHSLRSIAVFGVVTLLILLAARAGWTRLYSRVEQYGWPWFFISIAVMIALHDTYFYWTHRLMHHPRVFRLVHRTHHLSTSPTPWAAYAFSPIEALVQAGIGPLIVFTVPTHGVAFAAFMAWQITFNVFGHCGYEIYPRWFMRTPLGWVINSVTHHAQHHEAFRANYGLYFNVWDRLMGTNHPEYHARFERATAGRSAEEPSVAARRASPRNGYVVTISAPPGRSA